MLIYLQQEGRGIGLGDKIRAYAIQEQGFDTLDANRQLGLPDDNRDYWMAAAILKDLGISSVSLMTNNPDKIRGLKENGIHVHERIPHLVAVQGLAAAYVCAKQNRMGHLHEVRPELRMYRGG